MSHKVTFEFDCVDKEQHDKLAEQIQKEFGLGEGTKDGPKISSLAFCSIDEISKWD